MYPHDHPLRSPSACRCYRIVSFTPDALCGFLWVWISIQHMLESRLNVLSSSDFHATALPHSRDAVLTSRSIDNKAWCGLARDSSEVLPAAPQVTNMLRV